MRALTLVALLAIAGLAAADTSKLAKEEVALQPKSGGRGKNKTCCGYPLSGELGFLMTYYWLAMEEDFLDPTSGVPAGNRASPVNERAWVDIYGREGFFLGRVTEKFAWSLRMEGSGVMADGRVVNYWGSCKLGYGTCFQTLDPEIYPFGRGAGARTLKPFKSVAVDVRVIAIGDPLYLPELDGIPLPDGSIHDGCVRADDTGGAIKGRHLDFFVVKFANWGLVSDQLLGIGRVTPHIEAPRCEYLRDR